MVFLSNYLVFKIVLAALGRVDYPVAGDLELKYDTANKIYLSGGSLDYVDDYTLYTTIGGETTTHVIEGPNVIISDEQKITASDAASSDQFGYSTVINGDYAIIGSVNNDAAYIFKRNGSTGVWTEQTKLTPTSDSQNSTSDNFGQSVSISGNYAIVGAPNYNHNSTQRTGAVYIFVRSGTTWTQQQKLLASDLGAQDYFGRSVSISGDYAIIGAPLWDAGSSDTIEGVAYIFNRDGTTWSEQQKLIASDTASNDNYGASVSISGDYAIVGAWPEDDGGPDAGAVYIFIRSGTSWSQQVKLLASDPANSDNFGWYVDIDGDYVIVGARNGDSNVTDSGSAYIFKRDGTTWSQQEKLTASDAAANDRFGYSVSISGDYAIVGAYNNDDNNAESSGSAYVFKRSGTSWSEVNKILASDPAQDDEFGASVAIHENYVIVGAYRKNSYTGAAYIYPLKQVTNFYITDTGKYSVDATIAGLNYKTNEVEVTSLNPGNAVYTNDLKETSEIDHGTSTSKLKACSVSLDGTRVALGATDGRVKVYHLETGVWTLKKEYTKTNNFGAQVCLNDAGTRLFVSDPIDNSDTGKVYVYDYSGSAWGSSETHSWTSPNGSTSDNFGGIAGKGISCNSAGTRLLVVNGYTGSKKGYIFDHNGTNWNAAPTKSWSSGSSWWGITCALNDTGDRAFIGYQNGVDIFHYDGSNWPTSATKNYTGSDYFGASLTINGAGTRLLVSSYNYSSSGGKTDLYDYVGGSWNTSATQTINDPYGSNSLYGHGINMSRDGKRYLVAAHNSSTYFSAGGHVDMMEDTTGSGSFILKQVFKPDQANENMGSYQFHEGICLDQKGYTAVILSTGTDVSRIYSSNPIPTLDFDNYNKLSIGNAPTNTSSKLFLGSNVYDIGTLTSDLTIETPGLYRGLVYDTSSNAAYFNKTTVGAIASTTASYGKQDQVLNAGGDAGYGSGGDASQGGYGNSIDMSADGTRMVVGNAHYTDSNGRVWLYHLENGSWVLKQTWDGGERLGSQVAMNEAGTRAFAIYPGGGVKIWDYSSGAWDTSASGTYTITPGTISYEVPSVDCNKAGDVVIIGSGDSNNTWIYRLSGGSWSSEKNFSRRGSGVAMNGDGTRCFMGNRETHKVWESNYSGGSWGTETEIIDESSVSGYWPASLSTDSAGETVCIKSGDSGDGAIYERAGNGSWSASVSGILSRTEIYGTDKVALSYDGTVAIFGHMQNPNALSTGGHAILYTKSGSTWTLTQTLLNPSSSQHSGDYFGGGTGLAKTAKDRFVVAAMGDDNAGTNYGAIYTYTNAIPDFISFDTYNKLSLSGITNPTSKIHALLTGAETTTVYDIGSATNVYIESEGTYTAEMKDATNFALSSNVVTGDITPNLSLSENIISINKFTTTNASEMFGHADAKNHAFSKDNSIFVTSSDTADGSSGNGKVFIYKRGSDGTYTLDTTLNAVTGGTNNFGHSLDINDTGTRLVISEPEISWTNGEGRIHVYDRASTSASWPSTPTTTLNTSTDTGSHKGFGYELALSGDGNTIGTSTYGGTNYHRAYIFEYSSSSWSETKTWALSGTTDVGATCDLSHDGTRFVVGSFTTSGTKWYSFHKSGSTWAASATEHTLASASRANIRISGNGNMVLVGMETDSSCEIWEYDSSWSRTTTLTETTNFGCSMASNYAGTIFAIGESSHNSSQGRVFIYTKSGSTITLIKTLVNPDAGSSQWFGTTGGLEIDYYGHILAVNAPGYNSKGKVELFANPAAPSLTFDGYNKYTFTGADTDSTYKLKYESNTYDLGTISTVYIAYPGTYSAEIKGATNFALSSNVATIQTVTQPTLVSSISITASSAGWGSYTYEHQSTNTSSTYYEYKISADPTNSVYFIAYNWTTNKWYDTNPGTTHSTFGTSASDTSSTSRETTENPTVVYVMASNSLHAQFINPYFLGPSLDFDTYNKLTFSGLESGSTSNVTFNGNTYSIGSATNIYIENTGTYEAESKGTTTFALTSNVVGSGSINSTYPPVFTPVQLDADPVTDPAPSNPRSFRWQYTTGTKHYYRGYNGNTIDAGPMLIYYDTSDKKWYDGDTADHPNSFVVTTTQAVPSLSGATDPSSATGTSNAEYIHCVRINGTHLFSFKMAGWVTPTTPKLTHDGYKLVVSGITPTSSTLKYESNTYEIGTATNIYIENTGDYTAEIGNATDFAFTNTTVSGTIKTIEPGFASRYQGSMALTYDGKLYAWGMNDDGEAGVGTSSDITVPTLCTGITQGTVAKLLSGSDITENSRGEVSAIKTTDGKIYMAGKGDNNCIPGKTSDQTSFTDVTSYFGDQSLTANTVTMMSFTDASGAALTETGNVWTWGTHDSTYKKLGQASASTSSTPKQINFSSATGTITKITCGHYHTVALDSSGDVWFWGKNEINSDSWPSSITDEPQKVVDGKNIIGLSQSYGTMYAWDATGKMWNAGNNWEGQIGDGTTTANSSGKTLTEVTYFSSNNITINKVYAGGYFVFADTSDGYYCWGNGGNGVFGNGSTGNITSGPAKWTNVTNIKKFMASTQHTTAITEDGKYYAWGRDYHGGRGDSDSASDISYPKYIDALPNILAPSFDYDGYDKVFVGGTFVYEFYVSVKASGGSSLHYVNINQLSSSTLTLQTSMVTVHVPSSGSAADMFDGSNSTYISINDPNHEVGTKLWTLVTDKELADLTFVADRPVYMPGWRITCNGETVLNDTTNGSTSLTPSPATFTKILSLSGSMKFTKGTTTYDAGTSQIITVSDPGTYDAQLKKSGAFTLKSATVPATKASGLYTWAFHHGNFDNAYGDGDILTARDNGRFYADTPAYTSTSIGTITPTSVSSFVYKFYCTVLPGPVTGHTTDSDDTKWNLTEISSTTTTLTSSMFELVNSSYLNNGSVGGLFDSDTSESGGVYSIKEYNEGGLAVNRHMFTITTSVELLQLSISTHRLGYYPGIKIILNDTHTLVNETSNQGTGATPSPYTKSYTFSSNYIASTHGTTYTFAPPSGGLTANVLMVAGGGGGGGRAAAGGGGAGGLVYTAGTSLAQDATKTIVVGNGDSGGYGEAAQNGYDGKDTTFTGLTLADGGGGGGNSTDGTGVSGGSGGGGGGGGGSGSGGAAASGSQGTAGGASSSASYGGGGGGAGAAGSDYSGDYAGDGGTGKFFGTGSSFTDFGDEYGEGGWFAGGGAGGSNGAAGKFGGTPGRGGGGYGGNYYGYMGVQDVQHGGSQHALPHTGSGGGGSGSVTRDQHPGYNAVGNGGVKGHGGRGGSGIVLIQTNVAPPNGSNTAIVQVGNPRRRSLPPAVSYMGAEVNRFSIIDSASMPTYKLPTHWYVDPVGSNSNSVPTTEGAHSLQKRADGGTSNVWYATSNSYFNDEGTKMTQTVDAVFMPLEAQRYNVIISIGSNWNNDIQLEMAADGTAKLYRRNGANLIASGTIKCFTVGKWHHIALTVDSGGNAIGYVNGHPVVSGTYTSIPAVGSRAGNVQMRSGVDDEDGNSITFRKFLTYEVSTYNFHMSPKQVLQRAAEVGLGPKLEYDGLNTLKILNTEPGSTVRLFTSNVEDTSNVFIVADPAAGEYTVPEAGKYYAEIKGTDTFTITKTLDVSGTFPLYQYPPYDGTTSSLTQSASADTWNTWTISGASNGNGQYQAKTTHAPHSSSFTVYRAFNNDVSDDNGQYVDASQKINVGLTLQLPSAKTIRKYRMYPVDHSLSSGAIPGSSTDPTLSGGDPDYKSRPKSWILKGSNDGTNWTDLDTVTNKPISIYGDVYSIDSPASYQYYQMFVVNIVDTSALLRIGEWQLWGDA